MFSESKTYLNLYFKNVFLYIWGFKKGPLSN